MRKLVNMLLILTTVAMLSACGKSGSDSAPSFSEKLAAARKAESAFEAVLTDAPDLATAKASKEFTDMQKAMDEAKDAAKTDKEKTDVANLQKLVDVLVNQ